jgi:hypothetical protein
MVIDTPGFREKYEQLYPDALNQPCREYGCKNPVIYFLEDSANDGPGVFYCRSCLTKLIMIRGG